MTFRKLFATLCLTASLFALPAWTSTATASDCYRYVPVVSYECRYQPYQVCVVKYDHCGKPYHTYVTQYRTVHVPVVKYVKVHY